MNFKLLHEVKLNSNGRPNDFGLSLKKAVQAAGKYRQTPSLTAVVMRRHVEIQKAQTLRSHRQVRSMRVWPVTQRV